MEPENCGPVKPLHVFLKFLWRGGGGYSPSPHEHFVPPLSILVKVTKVHLYGNTSRFSVTNINYTLYNVMWKFFRCLYHLHAYTLTHVWPPHRRLSLFCLPPPPLLQFFKKNNNKTTTNPALNIQCDNANVDSWSHSLHIYIHA